MALGLLPGILVHRIGGGSVDNLDLKPPECKLKPPGISVLLGGTPGEAAAQIREAFPDAPSLHAAARIVASATLEAIRRTGFEIVEKATRHLPNHARLTHPDGVAGFSEENRLRLSNAFQNTEVHQT